MLKYLASRKILPVNNPPTGNHGGGLQVTLNCSPALPMRKWQRTLMGIGAILGVSIIVWLALAGISHSIYSTKTQAISADRNEKSLDWRDQQATDADSYFAKRARATEEGFFAAFPFHG